MEKENWDGVTARQASWARNKTRKGQLSVNIQVDQSDFVNTRNCRLAAGDRAPQKIGLLQVGRMYVLHLEKS